jgi:hypothetical protein
MASRKKEEEKKKETWDVFWFHDPAKYGPFAANHPRVAALDNKMGEYKFRVQALDEAEAKLAVAKLYRRPNIIIPVDSVKRVL